jgi:diguanylate cyclase (GGDEF)-like protein
VLLITQDAELLGRMRSCRPESARLLWRAPDRPLPQPAPTPDQTWIDLDDSRGLASETIGPRVFFYSRPPPENGELPRGRYIRKPCSESLAEVLWAGVRPRRSGVGSTGDGGRRDLPRWLLEFLELDLRELCRRCVARLPARLGYERVSLYLHDFEQGLLTLAETNHSRAIDLHVSLRAASEQGLMAAVVQTGLPLRVADAAKMRRHRDAPAAETARYRDGGCLVAPLVSEGRAWGVLNFSERRGAVPVDDATLLDICGFLGRVLQHARTYEQVRTEARSDALTGLLNQRAMNEALTREILRAQRFGAPLSLVSIDLDGLKAINDRFGHKAGDALLRHVAGKISAAARQIDSTARTGGDEFLVLLPATQLDGGERVARRVLASIAADAAEHEGQALAVSASAGVAEWRAPWNAARLLEAADQALYAAKRCGRNRVVCSRGESNTATEPQRPSAASRPAPTSAS